MFFGDNDRYSDKEQDPIESEKHIITFRFPFGSQAFWRRPITAAIHSDIVKDLVIEIKKTLSPSYQYHRAILFIWSILQTLFIHFQFNESQSREF